MFSLNNKVALVTGASRGLGKGIALTLAKAGADVIVNYLSSKEKAEEVADQIRDIGRKSMVLQADVSKADEVVRLFEKSVSGFERLDILVNNAGTSAAEDIFEISLSEWQRLMDTNLTSTFLCSKSAMEIMKEQNCGRIINISSMAGHQGAQFGHVHYASSKSGQLGFTKTLARTGATFGITVNAIAPGIIETELLHEIHGPEKMKALIKSVPLGLGRPEDIGAAVAFLASDEAGYITGATIDVNGGMYMH